MKVLKGLTVLIVEDEPMVGDLIENMLQGLAPDNVLHARDDKEALAVIREKKPDVVMLDVLLNGVESYTVAAELAAANIPFVFSTALDREALSPPWNLRTALKKPFTEQQLEASIKDAVDALLF